MNSIILMSFMRCHFAFQFSAYFVRLSPVSLVLFKVNIFSLSQTFCIINIEMSTVALFLCNIQLYIQSTLTSVNVTL